MVRAGFVHLGMHIQVEFIGFEQPGLLHGPQLHRIQEYTAVGCRSDEHGNLHTMARGEQSWPDAAGPLLLCVVSAQPIAQLRAGHRSLKFGQSQHGREELVLIKQHSFIEGHVRYAYDLFVA